MIKPREQFIVDKAGQKTAVIIGCSEYEQLMEDLHDLRVVAERKNEKSLTTAEFKKILKDK